MNLIKRIKNKLKNKNNSNVRKSEDFNYERVSYESFLSPKYPTKKEFEETVRKIQEKELESLQFKNTKNFIIEYNKRENIELEEKLFEIIGTYGIEDDLINKDFEYIKNSRMKRYNELKKFMDSLSSELINSNIYLKMVSIFMKTSIEDCKMIIEELMKEISNLKLTDDNQRIELNFNIPKERLSILPISISEQINIPYYDPKVYKREYIFKLDSDNRHIYTEYNDYVRNIYKLATDIYHLQLLNMLLTCPEQIDNYYFSILNNEYEHAFRTAYFVRKSSEKVVDNTYQISEKTMEKISRVIGLSFEKIVDMDYEEIEEYLKQKFGEKSKYDLKLRIDDISIDEEQIITIEQIGKDDDSNGPKLVLKRNKL